MQKTILLIIISCFTVKNVNSQITKGNWMVGGNASFLFTNSNTDNVGSKTTNINIAPNIGYFFIDKFAGGVRLSFNREHTKFAPGNNFQIFTNYSIGPFFRYYFLPKDRQYNILSEASYQFGSDKVETSNSTTSNGRSNNFTFSVGPVIYFNTSVGIEFLLNYKSAGNYVNSRSNSFGVGIGFQIHLEK